jgi:hypothetical protein
MNRECARERKRYRTRLEETSNQTRSNELSEIADGLIAQVIAPFKAKCGAPPAVIAAARGNGTISASGTAGSRASGLTGPSPLYAASDPSALTE